MYSSQDESYGRQGMKKRDWVYPALTAAVLITDQLLKSAARTRILEGETVPLQLTKKRRYLEISHGDSHVDGNSSTDNGSRRPEHSGNVRESSSHALLLARNSRNRGAAMNLMQRHPGIVMMISAGYTLALTILFAVTLGHAGGDVLKAGLSLLLGGAYSNTYDRLRRRYVTDYVSFNFGPKFLRNIVYNIGDFAIAVGALLLVIGANKSNEVT